MPISVRQEIAALLSAVAFVYLLGGAYGLIKEWDSSLGSVQKIFFATTAIGGIVFPLILAALVWEQKWRTAIVFASFVILVTIALSFVAVYAIEIQVLESSGDMATRLVSEIKKNMFYGQLHVAISQFGRGGALAVGILLILYFSNWIRGRRS
jgi:hypothetical protein